MKQLEELTYLGQMRRLRRLAQEALRNYGLADAKLTFIGQSENTTYRVDAPGAVLIADSSYVEGRYLLRIHRPGYQSAESLASELAWLAALRETGLVVPEPVPSLTGEFLTEAAAPGVPEPRRCSLFRWMRGRKSANQSRLKHFVALGRLMAQLHAQAAQWQLPPGFTRRCWDWEGLFGDDAGFNLPADEVWALLPQPYGGRFRIVADQTQTVMDELGTGPDVLGLVHADLGLGEESNVLFSGGEARPIDFDDCGFGYWVYDLATALGHWRLSDRWPSVRDTLLEGYSQIRPFPEQQLAHLDLFMAARHVSEILWATDIAQVNPSFCEELPQWRDWADMHVKQFLDDG